MSKINIEDMEGATPISESSLEEVVKLAKLQVKLEQRIENGKKFLAALQEELNELSSKTLPNKLALLGLESLTLESGEVVKVEPFISTSIKEENQNEAYAWLNDNNHGSIIKNVITVSFGVESKEEQERLKALLEENQFGFEQKESIHSSTLKAFVKERVEKEQEAESEESKNPIPKKLFNIYQGKITKVKKPKNK